MGFTDEIVKPYSGRPTCRNGTLATADGWQEFKIHEILGVSEGSAVFCAFTVWNVSDGMDESGDALDPLPVIRASTDATDQDARSLTINPDRDVKGFTFHPGEFVTSVWLKATGADCLYELLIESEVKPK
jgi:hypothetical protein